jgi:hypothetical protein
VKFLERTKAGTGALDLTPATAGIKHQTGDTLISRDRLFVGILEFQGTGYLLEILTLRPKEARHSCRAFLQAVDLRQPTAQEVDRNVHPP